MFFKRRGGVELVSIIILAVILGAATISIAVGLSKNAKNTAEGGLSANNSHLSALYQSLEDDLSDISSPGGGGGGEVEYGTAGSVQVLEGYTIATTVGLIEGTMRRNGLIDAELTIQNASYSIPEGYHDGTGKVTASFSNLVAENIKDGVNIGGVVGNYNGNYNAKQFSSGSFPATGTRDLVISNLPSDFDLLVVYVNKLWDGGPSGFVLYSKDNNKFPTDLNGTGLRSSGTILSTTSMTIVGTTCTIKFHAGTEIGSGTWYAFKI